MVWIIFGVYASGCWKGIICNVVLAEDFCKDLLSSTNIRTLDIGSDGSEFVRVSKITNHSKSTFKVVCSEIQRKAYLKRPGTRIGLHNHDTRAGSYKEDL